MITDLEVKQLFQDWHQPLEKYLSVDLFAQLPSQFVRGTMKNFGKKASPEYCMRNRFVFQQFNIIPKYCFSCYKIQICPQTVLELFKLMIILERLRLPKDNLRKCMVEVRPYVSTPYSGFIYSRSLKEAKNIQNSIKIILSESLMTDSPVFLKRGCSEFSVSYPKFKEIDKSGKPVMRYKNEWQQVEEFADRNVGEGQASINRRRDNNFPGYILQDAIIMLSWLKYAVTIGDSSYLKIIDKSLPKFKDITRSKFQHPE